MAEKTVEQRCYEALKARGETFAAAEMFAGKRDTKVISFPAKANYAALVSLTGFTV